MGVIVVTQLSILQGVELTKPQTSMEDITMLFLNRRTLLVGVSFFIFTNAVLSSPAHAASSSGEFGRDAAAIRWGGGGVTCPYLSAGGVSLH